MFFDFLFGTVKYDRQITQPPMWTTSPVTNGNWIDIRHAPKDGTRVDLWFPKIGRVADCHMEGGVWFNKIGQLSDSSYGAPTHFMFIPLGPNGEHLNDD